MHVAARGIGIAPHVAGDDVDAVGQAPLRDGAPRDGRRPAASRRRSPSFARVPARPWLRRCRSRPRRPGAGSAHAGRAHARGPRPRKAPRQSMAAVNRSAKASSSIASAQGFRCEDQPAGLPVRSTPRNSAMAGRSRSDSKYGVRFHGEPGHEVLAGERSDVVDGHSRAAGDRARRPASAARPPDAGGARARGRHRRRPRVLGEPGEEAQADDRGGQQVPGVEAVAQPIDRRRIGAGLGWRRLSGKDVLWRAPRGRARLPDGAAARSSITS